MVKCKDIHAQLNDYFKNHHSLTNDEANAVAKAWLSKYLNKNYEK